MFSEGGCTLRTGRHLLIMVVLMLASISGTVREPGDDTGTMSALSTDWVGLVLQETGPSSQHKTSCQVARCIPGIACANLHSQGLKRSQCLAHCRGKAVRLTLTAAKRHPSGRQVARGQVQALRAKGPCWPWTGCPGEPGAAAATGSPASIVTI